MVDKDWQEKVKGLLKAELKRKSVSYKGLADKLAQIRMQQTEANIKSEISRGGFTVVFLFNAWKPLEQMKLDCSKNSTFLQCNPDIVYSILYAFYMQLRA